MSAPSGIRPSPPPSPGFGPGSSARRYRACTVRTPRFVHFGQLRGFGAGAGIEATPDAVVGRTAATRPSPGPEREACSDAHCRLRTGGTINTDALDKARRCLSGKQSTAMASSQHSARSRGLPLGAAHAVPPPAGPSRSLGRYGNAVAAPIDVTGGEVGDHLGGAAWLSQDRSVHVVVDGEHLAADGLTHL